MSTIFTEDLAYLDTDISIGDPEIGRRGRELCLSAEGHEVRVMLTEEQLATLAAEIEVAGIGWREVPA